VDASNIPGWDKVDRLAGYLVGLLGEVDSDRNVKLSLSHKQVDQIVSLWNDLSQYDKCKVSYPPRHKVRLVQGSLKANKRRSTITPGIEGLQRCVHI
jgi:hypothetical protein